MRIGNLQIGGYAALAPMAGVADRAMREICRGFGCAMTVGELTSAKGISMNDKKSFALLSVSNDERPMGSQIFGYEPLIMARAAEQAARYQPDFIDINMGCPAPKVVRGGGGSALLKDLNLAEQIIAAVVKATDLPVGVKMRSGWDAESIVAVELAKRAEAAGAAMVAIHARTRAQMYAPGIDMQLIKKVKQAVSIPVVGNGDIYTPIDAAEMYEKTGCDLVMVGRGATGNPWIFSRINAYLNNSVLLPDPPVSERMRVMLKHIQKMILYKGEKIAIREARKHAAWYMKGLKGAARFRRQCGGLTKFDQLIELTARVIEQNLSTSDE